MPAPPLDAMMGKEGQELQALTAALARARSGLVQELVEVFHVVEVGGRPPIGGRAGTKGEWTIGDLILPVPGDIRRASYFSRCALGVTTRLGRRVSPGPYQRRHHAHDPFPWVAHVLSGRQASFRARVEWEKAGCRTTLDRRWERRRIRELGQVGILSSLRTRGLRGLFMRYVSRWTTKHPLHLTASSSSTSSPSSPPTPLPVSTISVAQTTETASSATLVPPSEPKASFTTAFAMLLYNVCYLAHTQSVEIPLSQAGDALSNLWAVCCSGELGRYVVAVFNFSWPA